MERLSVTPRPDWQQQCEDVGFLYHSMDGVYWDESHCYRFTSGQIDELDAAAANLHELCLKAVDHVVTEKRFDELKIPAGFHDYVTRSWQQREPSVYGRFDLAYDGNGPPKMLEYNADTPTALLEGSVVQWYWLKDVDAGRRPVQLDPREADRALEGVAPATRPATASLRFLLRRGPDEDYGNVEYLRDTAHAGRVRDGVHRRRRRSAGNVARSSSTHADVADPGRCFKLYPWEWMVREEFGRTPRARADAAGRAARGRCCCRTRASCRSCGSCIPATRTCCPRRSIAGAWAADYVHKPLLSREGANVTMFGGDEIILETDGTYGRRARCTRPMRRSRATRSRIRRSAPGSSATSRRAWASARTSRRSREHQPVRPALFRLSMDGAPGSRGRITEQD